MFDRLFAKLAEAPQPRLVHTGDAPEIYCEGAVCDLRAEVVRIHLCREIEGDPTKCEVAATIIMPVSGWMQSLAWARALAIKRRGH